MKKVFAFFSALLIVSGIKAQKTTVKKETVKPVADTVAPKISQSKTAASNSIKKTQKEWKVAPDIKKTSTEFKNVPAVKDIKKESIKK